MGDRLVSTQEVIPIADKTDDSGHQQAVALADAFGRAGKALVRAFDERLGDHGVSTPRSKVLFEVDRLGPVRLTDVARAVGITQATASNLAEALVRDGLVERHADHSDRRATLLTTTPAGRRQARSWALDYAMAAEELLGFLSPKEQTLLTESLNRLADRIVH